MPECEICGRKEDKLVPVSIEGAVLLACSSCARGKTPVKTYFTEMKKPAIVKKKREEPEYELADDYAEKIKKTRQAKGLSVEEFAKKISESVSVVRKMEAGKMIPTMKTAQKIRHLFGLKLYERIEEE